MAIIKTRTEQTRIGTVTVVFSNAATNDQAIAEIEQHCNENDLVRSGERNLAYVDDIDGRRLYYCFCA